MEYAHCMVALGGERDNTVPKSCISAAEIAVLKAIHGGGDCIHDVEPCDPPQDEDGNPIRVRNRDEMLRLKEVYSSPNSKPVVEAMFPGIAARVPETLDELDLDESLFKAQARATPDKKKAADKVSDRKADGPTRRPAKGERASASSSEQVAAEKDGIEPIRDEHADRSVLD